MEAASKFDCVQFMREAWARMDAETEGVADEGRAWYKSREYADSWLPKMSGRMRGQRGALSQKP